MNVITTILVDEGLTNSSYIICERVKFNEISIVDFGVLTTSDELHYLQIKHNANVEIDYVKGSKLHFAAHRYNWKLVTSKEDDFPYIEFINHLVRRR